MHNNNPLTDASLFLNSLSLEANLELQVTTTMNNMSTKHKRRDAILSMADIQNQGHVNGSYNDGPYQPMNSYAEDSLQAYGQYFSPAKYGSGVKSSSLLT